ncbi:GntR family transcriptional regulator [Azorhizobium doebereinerae]|uniref:GntR family transcriptional regulator n=1 Tax=Azorhizobium doebereinerae TaxID=281091 RepID=UPI00042104D4|nr:FCD domain-containing protein [Azorhizobium doebereinerae]
MAISKTAVLYSDLKEELLNGGYAPGAKLAIDALAQNFEVSASAVREVLSRLTSERLVDAMPQRGFSVAPVSRHDLIDLTEVRIDIEARCLRRSIALGDFDWEARILATWHRLSRTGATPEGRAHPDWPRLHAQFHDDLVSACDSLWWLRLRDQLYVQAERYRRMLLPRVRFERDIEIEHREIMNLVLARNADAACEALSAHLQLTTRLLLDSEFV